MMIRKYSALIIFALSLLSSPVWAARGQKILCPDTTGSKYANAFSDCISARMNALALEVPSMIEVCAAPKYSMMNAGYTNCLQRNFNRVREVSHLKPRVCPIGSEKIFHPHVNQKWVSCVREQVRILELILN